MEDEMILLPYQRRAIEGIKGHKYSVLLWCRQAGKSFALAYLSIQRCIELSNHKVVVISPSERQSKEFMDKVRLHISAIKNLKIDFFEDIETHILEARFPNGSKIIALPSKPETVRGFSGDVIMDEASHFDRGHEVYQAVFPTITRKKEYKLVAISTPRSKKDIFYLLWETAQNDPLWFRMKLTIYDAVKEGLEVDVESLRRGIKSELAWKTEYLCEFLEEEDILLPYEMITACEEETRIYDLRFCQGNIYVGVDIGRRHDFTVIAVLEEIGEILYLRALEVLKGISFSEQFNVLDHIASFARRVAIDETGIGMQLAEDLEKRWGTVKVQRVYFTARQKEELAERLKVRFQDRTIRIFPDNDLREDLHSIKRMVTDTGNIRYEGRTDDGHADRFWALALGIYASSRVEPKVYIPPVFAGIQWRLKHGTYAVA